VELRDIHRHIEAILMVVDEPVSELTLATVLEVTQDEVTAALAELVESYSERGFRPEERCWWMALL
jgi:segregation and condensation protein B